MSMFSTDPFFSSSSVASRCEKEPKHVCVSVCAAPSGSPRRQAAAADARFSQMTNRDASWQCACVRVRASGWACQRSDESCLIDGRMRMRGPLLRWSINDVIYFWGASGLYLYLLSLARRLSHILTVAQFVMCQRFSADKLGFI